MCFFLPKEMKRDLGGFKAVFFANPIFIGSFFQATKAEVRSSAWSPYYTLKRALIAKRHMRWDPLFLSGPLGESMIVSDSSESVHQSPVNFAAPLKSIMRRTK
uniref:CRAL-TRIO domain-containing protein n=1 Tax=Steinernema glaseri TaxID=37863 RepID=A0A1I7YM02_9BILA